MMRFEMGLSEATGKKNLVDFLWPMLLASGISTWPGTINNDDSKGWGVVEQVHILPDNL